MKTVTDMLSVLLPAMQLSKNARKESCLKLVIFLKNRIEYKRSRVFELT